MLRWDISSSIAYQAKRLFCLIEIKINLILRFTVAQVAGAEHSQFSFAINIINHFTVFHFVLPYGWLFSLLAGKAVYQLSAAAGLHLNYHLYARHTKIPYDRCNSPNNQVAPKVSFSESWCATSIAFRQVGAKCQKCNGDWGNLFKR
jgi:hypothetical protein